MQCIRESLGQLFEYKWRLETNGFSVNHLIIVGKSRNTDEGKLFLNQMNAIITANQSSQNVMIEYIDEQRLN